MSDTTTGKHTAGPWKVIPSPHGRKYKCVQYGKDDMYTSLEMLPADARLIAAAPEMLEALRAALAELYRVSPSQAAPIVRAAIRKATGDAA